jgi:hypothetical protein
LRLAKQQHPYAFSRAEGLKDEMKQYAWFVKGLLGSHSIEGGFSACWKNMVWMKRISKLVGNF